MPLMPSPPPSAARRRVPIGLPSNLMDDFVPVSPAYPKEEDDEDAGWGSMSREEARQEEPDSDDDEEEAKENARRGLIDLDAVAREEADVWGHRNDD